jgi:hypothetical protein
VIIISVQAHILEAKIVTLFSPELDEEYDRVGEVVGQMQAFKDDNGVWPDTLGALGPFFKELTEPQNEVSVMLH